jgi:hypothetical protein
MRLRDPERQAKYGFVDSIAQKFIDEAEEEILEIYDRIHKPRPSPTVKSLLDRPVSEFPRTDAEILGIDRDERRVNKESRANNQDQLILILEPVLKRLKRKKVLREVQREFQAQIEAATLRRLEVSSFEELTEKYLEGLKNKRREKDLDVDEREVRDDAISDLLRIYYQTEKRVEEELFAQRIEAAVTQHITAEQKGAKV